MAFRIEVHVQLPDGTFAYCPVAKYVDGKGELVREVVTQPTRKEAAEWAEFILPVRTNLVPIKP